MRLSFLAVAIACCVLSSGAYAQDTSNTASQQECDRQAAHPLDPNSVFKGGVAFDYIRTELALEWCLDAVSRFPNVARFHYQLGRAYEKARRMDDAVKEYEAAAAANYPIAFYNLGLYYERRNDPTSAAKYYDLADASGLQIDHTMFTFSAKGFASPSFFQAIYDDTAPVDRRNAVYIGQFLTLFANTPGCAELVPAWMPAIVTKIAQASTIGSLFGNLQGSNPSGTMDGAAQGGAKVGFEIGAGIAEQASAAQRDAKKFYTRYGCSSEISEKFFKNLGGWEQRL